MKLSLSELGFQFHLRSPHYKNIPKVQFSCAVSAVDQSDSLERISKGTATPETPQNVAKVTIIRRWKKMRAEELGVSLRMISAPTKKVLKELKLNGFDVYLVGGCVRDIILKRTPKDFDIITSADLKAVKRVFSRCEIVSRRFPICHVHIDGATVEVSSFNTHREENSPYDIPNLECDKQDLIRWSNCLHRDFTINGLIYDPYSKLVYDYFGGLDDIQKAKIRTVIPARSSFEEDCARILRGIRIAARLGFRLSKETATAMTELSSSILKLDRGRVMLEMNYMLSYGSAEASLRTLWKFGLLEIVLPIQAAYFVRNRFKRRDQRFNMLLTLFANMDKFLAPDRPSHSCVWIGLLAFHKAISENPRHPRVIATFCLTLRNGGNIAEAVRISRSIKAEPETSFEEVSGCDVVETATLVSEVRKLGRCVDEALWDMTREDFVREAMAGYPRAPFSNMVFIPMSLCARTCRVFDCVKDGNLYSFRRFARSGRDVDYQQLALGGLSEVRHVFSRIVFDTIYPFKS